MKTTRRNTYLFLALLLILLNFAGSQAQKPPDVGAALQGLLDQQVAKQGILGMAMAVRLADGTVVFKSSGHTDRDRKKVWSLDTVSALGSITKTYTAVVIMQLVEEGKLSLDNTINKWFPSQPGANKITVGMLLSHTSGLNNFIAKENERDPKWSREWAPLELVAEANRRGPVGEPGSAAYYSNTNYFLLGLIIEKVTGNTWADEVRSRIIKPLKLEHTAFAGDKGVWGGILVEGYVRTGGGYVSNLGISPFPHASTAWAAGGVVSSARDLLTFACALFDGTLISKQTLAKMATPVARDLSSGRLLGLGGMMHESLPAAFGMGGDAVGYHAYFIGMQNTKLVVVALVNVMGSDVVGPSLMALDYLRSMPPAGQGR